MNIDNNIVNPQIDLDNIILAHYIVISLTLVPAKVETLTGKEQRVALDAFAVVKEEPNATIKEGFTSKVLVKKLEEEDLSLGQKFLLFLQRIATAFLSVFGVKEADLKDELYQEIHARNFQESLKGLKQVKSDDENPVSNKVVEQGLSKEKLSQLQSQARLERHNALFEELNRELKTSNLGLRPVA